MSYKKLFTIIIPTYNRVENLKISLPIVLEYALPFYKNVCVYVSDNCSTDSTERFVKTLLPKYEDVLLYNRLNANIGAHGNFVDALNRANSPFAALIGDDDVVYSSYISTVLEVINKQPDVGLIAMNAVFANNQFIYQGLQYQHWEFGRGKYFHTVAEMLKSGFIISGQISMNVFRRDLFLQYAAYYNDDVYPGFGWYACMINGVFNNPCIYVDAPQLVAYSPTDLRWIENCPWYMIYGMGRVFEDLEKRKAGMFSSWLHYLSKSGIEEDCCATIGSYKALYHDRYKVMMKYASSIKTAKLINAYATWPKSCVKLMLITHKLSCYILSILRGK